MTPARRFRDRRRPTLRVIELAEAGIGVGLQDARVSGQMPCGVFAVAIARVEEGRSRRPRAGEGPIIAHIDPHPAGDRLGFGQDGNRRVVAVQALGGEDVPADQLDERGEAAGAGADPIGQGRHVEIDAFTGVALALAIEMR